MRPKRLANPRRLARRAGKVDQMSRGPCPPSAMHRVITPSDHPFDPEPALRETPISITAYPWAAISAVRKVADFGLPIAGPVSLSTSSTEYSPLLI